MSHRPTASPADIEWVDCHGDTRVAGYEVTVSDIAALEEPGDRRDDGKLTRQALHRIAAILSTHLQLLHAQTLAAHGTDPKTVTYRDCEGLARAENGLVGRRRSLIGLRKKFSPQVMTGHHTSRHLRPTKREIQNTSSFERENSHV